MSRHRPWRDEKCRLERFWVVGIFFGGLGERLRKLRRETVTLSHPAPLVGASPRPVLDASSIAVYVLSGRCVSALMTRLLSSLKSRQTRCVPARVSTVGVVFLLCLC